MRKIRLNKKAAADRLRERFEHDLNEPQREAATAPDGFNLILAGPGSGKTRVIIYRVAYLIAKGVPADSILLATFTRRAAREMVSRLDGLIGTQASQVWAGTFHHIGNRILRRSAQKLGFQANYTILDSTDQEDLVKLAFDDAGLTGKGRAGPKPSAVLHLISFAFNVGRPLAEIVEERRPEYATFIPEIERAATAYHSRKRAANCMDYDDLLGQWSRLIHEFPEERQAQGRKFQHILVDEMQDTNKVQIELVEAIAQAGAGNLTAVGDDAQSIYRFRGAHYDNILKFPERHPKTQVFKLEINYRSTPEIVAFTNASIACNKTGFPKHLVAVRPSGAKPVVLPTADAFEEADAVCQQILDSMEENVPLGQMAVLYRNHYDSILLQQKLVEHDIPYSVRSGVRFFESAHIKDVLAYLRILVNPRDEPAWNRLLQFLPGIGPKKSAALRACLLQAENPLKALEAPETMALIPAKGKGPFAAFVADVRKIQATEPEAHPSAAISAVLEGGYPAIVKEKYEKPENRLAEIEQFAVLASRFESLEKLIADLLLAGDVYGMDDANEQDPSETLVLSTIHQAKGLEWSRVFVLRLIEHGFPGDRALNEPGGEEEERRIFYVAVTRAMDQLILTYPLMVLRPGQGYIVASPSRFLNEIDPALTEPAAVETQNDLSWSSFHKPRARW